jgi:hypothetical protein
MDKIVHTNTPNRILQRAVERCGTAHVALACCFDFTLQSRFKPNSDSTFNRIRQHDQQDIVHLEWASNSSSHGTLYVLAS